MLSTLAFARRHEVNVFELPSGGASKVALIRCSKVEPMAEMRLERDLFPVELAVETNADPAGSSEVRWSKESIWLRRDEAPS